MKNINQKENILIEIHPYEPFYNANTKTLIVGTTPPMRFTKRSELFPDDVDFYYGSRDNYFWDLMGDVFNRHFKRVNSEESIVQRKTFLEDQSIGLVDIVLEFTRKEHNALDNNLNVSRYQNIFEILRNNPHIERIFFTGYSGPNSAENLMSKHLYENKVYNSIITRSIPRHKTFKINNRLINTFSLFSPSPSSRKKYQELLSHYMILKNYLHNSNP
jgi:G:T/U-mismatch repair DNA glycosylase